MKLRERVPDTVCSDLYQLLGGGRVHIGMAQWRRSCVGGEHHHQRNCVGMCLKC